MTQMWFKLYYLLLKSRFRFKAPKVVSDPIKGDVSFEVLMTRWNAVREGLTDVLEHTSIRTLEKTVYKNPIAGRGNFFNAIKMIELHPRHHRMQINRLLYEYGD